MLSFQIEEATQRCVGHLTYIIAEFQSPKFNPDIQVLGLSTSPPFEKPRGSLSRFVRVLHIDSFPPFLQLPIHPASLSLSLD